ncbi:hypothetical protein [Arthrobacter ramosus]|uniref:hypothetical protein n=1 Tax=Arthrobacter ramosus TaxID=1672 RepID=UPI001F45031D|nr:hypothetical protein [Arthrobacter ramosus]
MDSTETISVLLRGVSTPLSRRRDPFPPARQPKFAERESFGAAVPVAENIALERYFV